MISSLIWESHPVSVSDGQNHIIEQTPLKLYPVEKFEKRRRSKK